MVPWNAMGAKVGWNQKNSFETLTIDIDRYIQTFFQFSFSAFRRVSNMLNIEGYGKI